MEGQYQIIGALVKTIQYIGYNLALLIRYRAVLLIFEKTNHVPTSVYNQAEEDSEIIREKLTNQTMGNIIGYVRATEALSQRDIDQLIEILRKRNDLIHQYYKRKDFEKHSENLLFLENEKRYLSNFLSAAQNFINNLCKLIDSAKEEYSLIM